MTNRNDVSKRDAATDASTNPPPRLSWETPTLVSADIDKTAAHIDTFTDGVTATGYRYGS